LAKYQCRSALSQQWDVFTWRHSTPTGGTRGTPAIEHQVSAKKAETSTGELSNLTKATEGPLQPKIDRGRLNWRNISVEAPYRSGEASPQPIQRQQEEQEETPEIQAQLAADSAEKTAGESSNSTITSDGRKRQPFKVRWQQIQQKKQQENQAIQR
jgi:hypothetical protein